jgi:hypothetical protein
MHSPGQTGRDELFTDVRRPSFMGDGQPMSRALRRVTGHLSRCAVEMRRCRERVGYTPNLLWPRTFNEKVLSRKLKRPDPLWTQLSDKVAAKTIAAERVGSEFVIETYQVVSTPDEIDLSALPDRFVVKASHGCGFNRIVRDKSTVDVGELRAQCAGWQSRSWGHLTNETWYQRIPRRILIERYLEDGSRDVPLDFKCWVFHGRVEYIQVDFDRFTRHTRNFYDREWRRQSWGLKFPPGPDLARPAPLDELIGLAERLSGGLPFLRVDLYCVNEHELYSGEFTLAPEAGWGRFWPDASIDRMLGGHW